MLFSFQIVLALLMDLIVGDPRWFPHPVKLVGLLCNLFEKLTRKVSEGLGLSICGLITFFAVVVISTGATWFFLTIFKVIHPLAGDVAAIFILYLCIAAGDLFRHSRCVHHFLICGDVAQAREAVAMLVGRDTAEMDQAAIARACIESVAENLVDGITAPLFWAVISGSIAVVFTLDAIMGAALGAMVYKTVNTMDSMVGYKNEQYADFGLFPAKADDALNFIPARLSGLCVIAAAYLINFDARQGAMIFFKDRLRSPSPNSGHTEAALAGALGIQLGGTASYFGVLSAKPLIGRGLRIPAPSDILSSNRLVLASTVVFLLLSLILHSFFLYIAI